MSEAKTEIIVEKEPQDTILTAKLLTDNPAADPTARRIVYVKKGPIDDVLKHVNELAALPPNELEASLNNWHGRSA